MVPVYGLVQFVGRSLPPGFPIARTAWVAIWIPVVLSPLIEEPLKMVGPIRRWTLDGRTEAVPWVQGAAVGAGFGLVELGGYLSAVPAVLGPAYAEKILAFRLAFALPLHMVTTGLAASALAKSWGRSPRVWFAFVAFVPSILIHAGYNAIVLALPSGMLG